MRTRKCISYDGGECDVVFTFKPRGTTRIRCDDCAKEQNRINTRKSNAERLAWEKQWRAANPEHSSAVRT